MFILSVNQKQKYTSVKKHYKFENKCSIIYYLNHYRIANYNKQSKQQSVNYISTKLWRVYVFIVIYMCVSLCVCVYVCVCVCVCMCVMRVCLCVCLSVSEQNSSRMDIKIVRLFSITFYNQNNPRFNTTYKTCSVYFSCFSALSTSLNERRRVFEVYCLKVDIERLDLDLNSFTGIN